MPTNRYGMPDGAYAQGAQAAKEANPITAALRNSASNTAPQPLQPSTNTPVTRDGKVNLALTAPTPLTGRYSNGDSDVNDASTILGNAYQTYLGRAGSPTEIQSQLAGQGLQPGDPRVGATGLNSVVSSIYNSPEAGAYRTKLQAPPPTHGSALDFIHQWQGSHNPREGISPLVSALQSGGYSNVSPYMYGSTQSHNELTLDGQKFKVLGGEDTPGAYWYQGGNDSAPAPSVRNPFNVSVMNALQGGQNMTPSYTDTLLQQLMQQLALSNSLYK